MLKSGSASVKIYNQKPGFPCFRMMHHAGQRRILRTLAEIAAVQPFDVALDDAAHEDAAALKIFGTHSLVEAAKHFARHHRASIKPAFTTSAPAKSPDRFAPRNKRWS